MPTPKPGVSLDRIAHVLDESPKEIERLIREGMPSLGKGLFDLAKSTRWYVQRVRKQMEQTEKLRNERTLDEMAHLFRRDPRWINKLAHERGFPKIARGRYNIIDAVQWYIDRMEDQIEELKTGGEKMIDVELRIAKAKAEILEIKAARERGEAVTIDIVLQELEPVMSSIRSILLGIPKHAARELADRHIEEYLDNYIRKTLDELATIPHKLGRAATTQDVGDVALDISVEAAAANDSERVGRPVSVPERGSKRRKRAVADK
jgi:phage terminase Nu1 subunit (DNA packaging protein)